MNTRRDNANPTSKEYDFEKLLEEVMPFIISLCKGTSSVIEFDDMRSVLMMQTWISWKEWDPARNVKFTTYLFPALKNKRNMELRRMAAQKRGGEDEIFSLDAPISQQDGENCTFAAFVANMNKSNSPEERLFASEVLSIVYKVVNKQRTEMARKILLLVLDGETQVNVAAKCSCKQSLVSYYLKQFRKQLAVALRTEGFDEYVSFA